MNPVFNEVVPHTGDLRIYQDTFYARHWFTPTDGTVDIYRDFEVCDDDHIMNMEPTLDYCVNTKSGDYCLGLTFMAYNGYTEHITGVFKKPLKAKKRYKISFYLKFHYTKTPFISNGFGYKISKDSIVFDTDEYFNYKFSPFYDYLFKNKKIYADYEIKDYVLDTTWVKYESIYEAKGGEKFITFGKFAYPDDRKIIKQFKDQRYFPTEKNFLKFLNKDKSLVCKRFFGKEETFVLDEHNYYYLDLIEITPIEESRVLESGQERFASEVQKKDEIDINSSDCPICVDSDPNTYTPSSREFIVDKGFVGEMILELGIRLLPMEKYVVNYGNKCSITIVNTDHNFLDYSETTYTLKYPARKLRKKPIKFSVEKISQSELERLKREYSKYEVVTTSTFNGLIFKKE